MDMNCKGGGREGGGRENQHYNINGMARGEFTCILKIESTVQSDV